MARKTVDKPAKKSGTRAGGASKSSAAKKSSGTKKAASSKKSTAAKKTTAPKKTGASGGRKRSDKDIEIIEKSEGRAAAASGFKMSQEITVLLLFAFCVILILGNFNLTGSLGSAVNSVLFGLFGSGAYVFPFAFFFICVFLIVNQHNGASIVKSGAILLLYLDLTMLFALWWNADFETRRAGYAGDPFYKYSVEYKQGGGFIGGHLLNFLLNLTGHFGAIVIMLTIAVICIVILTGKSIIRLVTEGSKAAATSVRDTAYDAYEEIEERRHRKNERQGRVIHGRKQVTGNYMENLKLEGEDESGSDEMRELSDASLQDDIDLEELSRNIEEKVSDTVPVEEKKDDVIIPFIRPAIEIIPEEEYEEPEVDEYKENKEPEYEDVPVSFDEYKADKEEVEAEEDDPEDKFAVFKRTMKEFEKFEEERPPKEASSENRKKREIASSSIPEGIVINHDETDEYILPDPSMLEKGKRHSGSDRNEIKEVSERLKETLANFGVNIEITEVNCGPTVTRYEFTLEKGVKVSKILGLTDDIKLALAAENIRIEAPIPGKSAVGIEVPNRNVQPVMLRDLFESQEFKEASSKISFAVGKDIGGKAVVFDIAKMPHVLIAGATGAGKSVCINTIIMSILFKARPDEVKLIMIDPKVVELSIYNGIPHLLIPVVTDPQKAAGALQWGVNEMDRRYNVFAEKAVRDLKGYNAKAAKEGLEVMPQLVIIVDELADLMMTAKNDVENAIVRLAQKARAAGIHLIIATQRPSVDVITGLIKANMPSRVAFTVTSGTDSRTILDTVGAEKLLGKGDMLFYPVGYPKPARVQGAFVSDSDVEKIVEFIRGQKKEEEDSSEITAQIEKHVSDKENGTQGIQESTENDGDELFWEVAEFVVNLDKPNASVSLLQRRFRLGFNRAARIMDELHEAGIVGEESGTKGRSIIMDKEQFEQLKEERL